jgi:hypothetical protein
MPKPLYDRAVVDSAVERFDAADLNTVERLLAGCEAAFAALEQFHREAPALRHGAADPEVIAGFARHELNDLIAALQDAIPPTVRAYNALLRDTDDRSPVE